MPHLIIDGYNFIRRIPHFLAAESDGLESGRYALLLALEEYAANLGCRVTVVFDGGSRPSFMGADFPREDKFAGIDILYSKRGQTADTAIIDLLKSLRQELQEGNSSWDGGEIVVTDDFAIRDEAIKNGAFVKSPQDLFEAMEKKIRIAY